jgi:tetratricopeptide (TPR) repeat protein
VLPPALISSLRFVGTIAPSPLTDQMVEVGKSGTRRRGTETRVSLCVQLSFTICRHNSKPGRWVSPPGSKFAGIALVATAPRPSQGKKLAMDWKKLDANDLDTLLADLTEQRKWEEATNIITVLLAEVPADWKAIRQNDRELECIFWDQSEFLAFIRYQEEHGEVSNIVWLSGLSYSKLWWRLAFLYRKQGLYGNALLCVEQGLKLEGDHPQLWVQKSIIFQAAKRHDEALAALRMAARLRPWSDPATMAWLLRLQGYNLIELGLLEKAKAAYRESLQLEPGNEVASRELAYITKLEEERPRNPRNVPWFMALLQTPPSDPITRQFIADAQGLEPVAGPEVVGRENYRLISSAFFARGWEGFEEEFNRLYPPTRQDYLAMKSELLREPIFLNIVHQRLARVFTGEVTVDGLVNEIYGQTRPPTRD